jgi:hypothetical protein
LEDLKYLFEDHVVIPWHRDPELQSVCVTKILKKCVLENGESPEKMKTMAGNSTIYPGKRLHNYGKSPCY